MLDGPQTDRRLLHWLAFAVLLMGSAVATWPAPRAHAQEEASPSAANDTDDVGDTLTTDPGPEPAGDTPELEGINVFRLLVRAEGGPELREVLCEATLRGRLPVAHGDQGGVDDGLIRALCG